VLHGTVVPLSRPPMSCSSHQIMGYLWGTGTDRERVCPQQGPTCQGKLIPSKRRNATPIDRRPCFTAALSVRRLSISPAGRGRTELYYITNIQTLFGPNSDAPQIPRSRALRVWSGRCQLNFVMRLFRQFFCIFLTVDKAIISAVYGNLALVHSHLWYLSSIQ